MFFSLSSLRFAVTINSLPSRHFCSINMTCLQSIFASGREKGNTFRSDVIESQFRRISFREGMRWKQCVLAWPDYRRTEGKQNKRNWWIDARRKGYRKSYCEGFKVADFMATTELSDLCVGAFSLERIARECFRSNSWKKRTRFVSPSPRTIAAVSRHEIGTSFVSKVAALSRRRDDCDNLMVSQRFGVIFQIKSERAAPQSQTKVEYEEEKKVIPIQ